MDSNDFERVFKRNNKRLFLIALSFTANQYDAEDILQNSFMKLLKTKTEFENDEHIDKWLTSVTVNESKNLLKSAFRKKSADFEDYIATYSFESEKSEDLFNAVMSLPKKLRTVIHLFYYEDMPIKEIADMLNIKQSAVKTRLCRAREQLKNQLAQVTFERNERETLFNTMSEGVLLFNSDGSLIRANNAAAELLNFDKDKSFHLNRCHIPELVEEAQKTIKNEEPFEKEFCFYRNGQNISLWIKGTILCRKGEKRLLLTVTDLTNLRKLESFRADFIANVSHEIKTPLTCISGAAEALEETNNPENRAKLTAMLKKHSERLNNLVKDILNLARLEKSPRKESTAEKIILSSVIDNVIDIETDRVKECGFELKLADNLPLTVSGDADLLEQALINLIENALRYSNGKSITLSVTQEEANAVLTVKDDGIGIAPEHHDRLFERFYRVDKSRSRELGGTGLGLAIVKHIALIHNGKAGIISSPGKGAEFRITLPL